MTHLILVMLRKLRIMGDSERRTKQSPLKVVSYATSIGVHALFSYKHMHVHCTCSLVSIAFQPFIPKTWKVWSI